MSSLLLFRSKGNVSPWPLETLSPTFPPAPVAVLVRRSNFYNQNPSRPHGKSMELFTLSSNFFIPMSFAAETFFVVLACLSHTQYFYVLTQLVLDFGLWFLIFFLQHVSQEFTPKIFDTVFEIVSVFPMSMSSLILFKSKGNVSPWPLETLSPTFPPAPVVVLVRRSNFHNQNPSRPHGKSMEFVTLSSNFFIPMSFAAGTIFIVLDGLSHTYKNPHSVFLSTDPADQWSLFQSMSSKCGVCLGWNSKLPRWPMLFACVFVQPEQYNLIDTTPSNSMVLYCHLCLLLLFKHSLTKMKTCSSPLPLWSQHFHGHQGSN